MEPLTDW